MDCIRARHAGRATARKWRRNSTSPSKRGVCPWRGKGNREHAARRARYSVWQELLGVGDLLALAHHADDQVETRLWQLLTGREPGGMPTERQLGAARLVRPLLSIRRAAINRYAEHFGLRWIDDPSNADLRLDRNYIRSRIVPVIEDRFPDALQRLAGPRPTATSPAPLPLHQASPATIRRWLHSGGLPVAHATVAEIERQTSAAPDRMPCIEVAPGVARVALFGPLAPGSRNRPAACCRAKRWMHVADSGRHAQLAT